MIYPDCAQLSRYFLQKADEAGSEAFEFHMNDVQPIRPDMKRKVTPLRYAYRKLMPCIACQRNSWRERN